MVEYRGEGSVEEVVAVGLVLVLFFIFSTWSD